MRRKRIISCMMLLVVFFTLMSMLTGCATSEKIPIPKVEKDVYIYDEDILPARVYSPNLKSPDNAPEGCSSLQAEIFFSNREERTEGKKEGRILNDTIEALSRICNFNKSDIIVQDIRFEKYANIIFDKNIYTMRNKVLDFLAQQGIESIGRFGKWDYFWSHDAFESGRNVIQIRRIC